MSVLISNFCNVNNIQVKTLKLSNISEKKYHGTFGELFVVIISCITRANGIIATLILQSTG